MTITLNHTIVPARDKKASAEFFAGIFGLKVESPVGHFAAVRVNDTLTFDFAERSGFDVRGARTRQVAVDARKEGWKTPVPSPA